MNRKDLMIYRREFLQAAAGGVAVGWGRTSPSVEQRERRPSLPFVHLHCHSHYSLLDGMARIDELVAQAKSLGMNALALTDHGNLFGAIEFYEACRREEIKPILGYEAYVAPIGSGVRQPRGSVRHESAFHLTILAQNPTGFRNLLRLASAAHPRHTYREPCIDKELLERHQEGLIVLSGSASSELSTLIRAGRFDDARRLAEWFARILGDRFYIEIQDHGLEIERRCAQGAIRIAGQLGLPLVATCDVHYLRPADAQAHEVLLCINVGKTLSDPRRPRYGSDQFYLKTPQEMYANFPDRPDAVRRSQEIADRIDLELDLGKRHFPVFAAPGGKDDHCYLADLCEDGLSQRYRHKGPEVMQAARQRLTAELAEIHELDLASYFLIVWDIARHARERGIRCAVRGSACGAIVSYVLSLSHVDPLEYDLLFERFLVPSRAGAPEIDVELETGRSDEVIDYVRAKHGPSRVARVAGIGIMRARAVLRDVGRILEIAPACIDQVVNTLAEIPSATLSQVLEESADLRAQFEKDSVVRRTIEIALRLEGLGRNAGSSESLVIGDGDLVERVPLTKIGGVVATQWGARLLEKVGMLKTRLLGRRDLTLLAETVRLVEETDGRPIDLTQIPLDDPGTFALLQRGERCGVFQFESEGMRKLLVRLCPHRFQDMIALNALQRPGPLEAGLVERYINAKHGRERGAYAHPVMKEVLEETYGVMLYQEQAMRILNRLGGIELADAYQCIEAMSNNKPDVIGRYRAQFLSASQDHGLSAGQADEIFSLIERSAGCSFNKSHATACALITYQAAYLKAHYPSEFMAAVLTISDWPDAKIRSTALWTIGQATGTRSRWRWTVVGEPLPAVACRVELEPGETPLISFFRSEESWYVLTTRRVVGCYLGRSVNVPAFNVVGHRFGDFKGVEGARFEVVRLRLASGQDVALEYETGPASTAPMRYFWYWQVKFPILDILRERKPRSSSPRSFERPCAPPPALSTRSTDSEPRSREWEGRTGGTP